jgi:hypothetical protein
VSQSEPHQLICWQCNKKTPYTESAERKCIHCGAEISTADELYGDKGGKKIKVIVQLKTRTGRIDIDLDEIKAIIEEEMTSYQVIPHPIPIFIVRKKEEGDDLDAIFDRLYEKFGDHQKGLTLRMNRIARSSNIMITLLYTGSGKKPSITLNLFLIGLTFLTIFLSGIYNYSQGILSQGLDLQELVLFDTEFSLDSILFGLQFAAVLLVILMIKDYQIIIGYIRRTKTLFGTYFIPSIPIIELGSLGSVLRQNDLPKNNKELLSNVSYGTIMAWIVSVFLFLVTLNLGHVDPNAASAYQENSMMLGYQPLILKFIMIGNDYMIIPLITNAYTKTLLSPITMAALAGIYIIGFNLSPAGYFNGGFLTRAIYGKGVHVLMTYFVIFAFYLIGLEYISLILVAMVIVLRAPSVLNSTTAITPGQRYIYWLMLLLSLLSFPIPL